MTLLAKQVPEAPGQAHKFDEVLCIKLIRKLGQCRWYRPTATGFQNQRTTFIPYTVIWIGLHGVQLFVNRFWNP